MSTLISLPKDTMSVMWNGYATPYSSTGCDWMADASWVCDRDILSERALTLINRWIDWNVCQRPYKRGEVLPKRYIDYCNRQAYSLAYRLQSQYDIVIEFQS